MSASAVIIARMKQGSAKAGLLHTALAAPRAPAFPSASLCLRDASAALSGARPCALSAVKSTSPAARHNGRLAWPTVAPTLGATPDSVKTQESSYIDHRSKTPPRARDSAAGHRLRRRGSYTPLYKAEQAVNQQLQVARLPTVEVSAGSRRGATSASHGRRRGAQRVAMPFSVAAHAGRGRRTEAH